MRFRDCSDLRLYKHLLLVLYLLVDSNPTYAWKKQVNCLIFKQLTQSF